MILRGTVPLKFHHVHNYVRLSYEDKNGNSSESITCSGMQTRRDTQAYISTEMLSSARVYVSINDEKTKGKSRGVLTN